MAHRSVSEVMTADVATVAENTPFKDVAAVMAARRVSALPVLDADRRVAGLVSEADLMRKTEAQEDPHARRLPWWRRHGWRRKARGVTARQLMTSPVFTIGPGASVVEAARSMDRHQVKRLPVTDAGGHLTGIVSRRDLVKIFLRPDPEIEDEIRHEVFEGYLWTNPVLVQVSVTDGVVTLAGEVEKKSMIPVAVRMAESVDGVVAVVDKLTFGIDDTVGALPAEPDPRDY